MFGRKTGVYSESTKLIFKRQNIIQDEYIFYPRDYGVRNNGKICNTIIKGRSEIMSEFTLDEIIFGMNTLPTEHNIKASLAELRRRGYNAYFDTYYNKWVLS